MNVRFAVLSLAGLTLASLSAYADPPAAAPAAAPDAAPTAPAASKPHHASAHTHHAKMAALSPEQETGALNALSAAGYTNVSDLKAGAAGVSASAMKDGKTVNVTVSPNGDIQPAS